AHALSHEAPRVGGDRGAAHGRRDQGLLRRDRGGGGRGGGEDAVSNRGGGRDRPEEEPDLVALPPRPHAAREEGRRRGHLPTPERRGGAHASVRQVLTAND